MLNRKGVTLNGKHNTDYGMIMESKVIGSPDLKTKYVNVPGSDSTLDLSEYPNGMRYGRRKLTYTLGILGDRSKWPVVYSRVMNDLHGKEIICINDDDQSFFYRGRAEISDWKFTSIKGQIIITVNAEPYKLENQLYDNWHWDLFSFVDGIIRKYVDKESPCTINVIGTGKTTTCRIEARNAYNLAVIYEGTTYPLHNGVNILEDIIFETGTYQLDFIGTGTVAIYYEGGKL